MKKMKIAALLLTGCMVLSLSACNFIPGMKNNRDDDDDKRIEKSETTEEETTTTTAEETTTEETTEATSEETTSEESKGIEESKETEASKENGGSTFSGKILDFEDMHFYVNGKKYTLGKTTLQEMIDDGVPFKESEIKNASKEIKKNSQSLYGFGIQLDKYWTPLLYVMNLSSEAKPMSECVVYRVSMYNIEKNYKNGANFQFEFPYKMTMDEIIANCGEPKEAANKVHDDGINGNYTDTLRYRQKATKYLGSREYQFVFAKGEMSRITLTYIP